MQEDVIGTLRTLGHAVETCSLCGYPLPVRNMTREEATPTEGVRSEYEDICPECGRLLVQGKQPLVSLDDAEGPLESQD